jgi:hypothetical protein
MAALILFRRLEGIAAKAGVRLASGRPVDPWGAFLGSTPLRGTDRRSNPWISKNGAAAVEPTFGIRQSDVEGRGDYARFRSGS